MTTNVAVQPRYHVLLIGCDEYPPAYPSLAGCVNDIDAIERVLLDGNGVGLPREQISVTRLAAPLSTATSTSSLLAQTRLPTRANIEAALRKLAGPEVSISDRVLIYYSGHGDQRRRSGSRTYQEAIVPVDLNPLYDTEMNSLVSAIAERTADLTVVLDCCHSGGATRSLSGRPMLGSDRFLGGGDDLPEPPADPPPAAGPAGLVPAASAVAGMLESLAPRYVAVAACQSGERAAEGAQAQERTLGVFTSSLLALLKEAGPARWPSLRWADLWHSLEDTIDARCSALGRPVQVPLLIGRTERKIFGGAWEPGDAGYSVRREQDGTYLVGAGNLIGVSDDAVIGVYGPQPARFPTHGSPEDAQAQVGRIVIVHAGRSSSVGTAMGAPFALPPGARGRLLQSGPSDRLRVLLDPADPAVTSELEASTILVVVPPGSTDAEVTVTRVPPDGWAIGNDVEDTIATVPVDAPPLALRAGLEAYARHNAVLRLARRSNDSRLYKTLRMRLLSLGRVGDPPVPSSAAGRQREVQRDSQRIYQMAQGTRFCIRVTSSYTETLYVRVFGCCAAGQVEELGDVSLAPGEEQLLWQRGEIGRPFVVALDFPRWTTERLVAIATTRAGADLRHLAVSEKLQTVVNAHIPRRRGAAGGIRALPASTPIVMPLELWTSDTQLTRIGPG